MGIKKVKTVFSRGVIMKQYGAARNGNLERVKELVTKDNVEEKKRCWKDGSS